MKEALIGLGCEMVRMEAPFSVWTQELAKRLCALLKARRLAIFLEHAKGFHLETAWQGRATPWKPSHDLQVKLRHLWGEMLAEGKGRPAQEWMEVAPYLCIPMFHEEFRSGIFSGEILPLGMLVVEPGNQAPRESLEGVPFFVAAMLFRKRTLGEIAAQIERTATELSRMKETLWQEREIHRLGWRSLIGGRAPAMQEVLEMLARVTRSLTSVLLEGESGTGKELFARAIHDQGPLAQQPFVAVNCGSFSSEILESQLFGHMKGAFTGAVADQIGLFAQAHGGTLFMDEIGELPLALQAKFLRVLQDGEVRPLGGGQVKKVNFRLIAATNRDLDERVESGMFRRDLFYRLHVVSIRLPALRQRREDIPLLVRHFLKKKKISSKALRALCEFDWPGNVRQLESTLKVMQSLQRKKRIDLKDLPEEIRVGVREEVPLPYEEAKMRFVRSYVERLMTTTRGDVPLAAQCAGVARESFYRLMKQYRVKP